MSYETAALRYNNSQLFHIESSHQSSVDWLVSRFGELFPEDDIRMLYQSVREKYEATATVLDFIPLLVQKEVRNHLLSEALSEHERSELEVSLE